MSLTTLVTFVEVFKMDQNNVREGVHFCKMLKEVNFQK